MPPSSVGTWPSPPPPTVLLFDESASVPPPPLHAAARRLLLCTSMSPSHMVDNSWCSRCCCLCVYPCTCARCLHACASACMPAHVPVCLRTCLYACVCNLTQCLAGVLPHPHLCQPDRMGRSRFDTSRSLIPVAVDTHGSRYRHALSMPRHFLLGLMCGSLLLLDMNLHRCSAACRSSTRCQHY